MVSAMVEHVEPDDDDIEEVVDESIADDEGLYEMQESSLSYFGADFDIRGLVQRLGDGDIIIPRFDPDESDGATLAGFQRQRVWTKPKMEQFIESLLLGWPVPSIFLVLDTDQRYLVLDGQQRLTALRHFYSGFYPDGRKFQLADVAEHLQQATYETLATESKRKLNNTFIQATVIEPKGKDGPESVYRLFGRLNSGGVSLTAQEIRVALFLGPVVDWIRDLNRDGYWRRLYGKPNPRLKDHELVLRTLAMEDVLSEIDGNWDDEELRRAVYKPPMSEFLNLFLSTNREMESVDKEGLTTSFAAASKLLFEAADRDGLRFNGRINAAHVDATMSTLMWLQRQDALPNKRAVATALNELRANADYIEYVTQSTSHRENVYGRLQLALEALS
jgi:hypothetical protein